MDVIGIFGANGFIGRHLTRALVGRGLRVVCFGRHFPLDFESEFGNRADLRLIDFHDDMDVYRKLIGITHVVHLINSSNAAVGNEKVVADINSNVIPHVIFVKSCILSGVKSFTFLSSGGTVYGIPQKVPIDESHPTFPINSYGLNKLFSEHYLRMLSRNSGMGYNILRVANPYGPGQLGIGGQGLIGTIMQRYLQGQPVSIFGSGLHQRDYLYIDDTIDAIVRAVEREPLNDVVNIGSGVGVSILAVVDAVEAALGCQIAREHVPDRTTDAADNILDTSRAERLLGWKTVTPFADGVAKTVAWNLRHRAVAGGGI
ncbi:MULTISPECIES: NAD-dependent epimerase/dehydratase family protein [unclassified Novosphingobium]|uniref:NAD-dependent epimerase/dehydratase family protein n=1 Tax=unclassified Novosphingobium TaxID=2644732 RepID=UPI001493DF51|nr:MULTISPECIES: NAD-dependent epimerase/dehydratase family protein [unclassified Novosphingobium]MBB3356493.1 UDP-glucose 4-epimerase [Novosphingobium sp. BK256]MBB3372894.1 UDP-glucose 4-epimerase [Novosphingobium sp. BK280]MBB3377262.1 UDP-glucose 4-epimerase [Novosphingobium sp. BK258]MBB3419327.1 UDP-glucose 4-epimerase [Novosphingobium sp. BK267]MBB3448856.1 UDP-glucose 4-epimerase [Novosphingobium sp. BK352]